MIEPRVLLTGVAFGESPRWHDDRLWFSDWGAGEVIAVDPAGQSEVVVRVPDSPFCLDWLPDGRLLVVSGGKGLLLRQETDGSLTTHADLSGLSSYAYNEVAADSRGNAFVNNIGFEFGGEVSTGFVAVVSADGSVRQVADNVAFPNGMLVTPDDSTLILAESHASRLTAFDIGTDGDLTNRRVWASLDEAYPDGICLDAEGAVWYADVPNRRCVRVREGGEVMQTVELDRGCFSCALGGPAGRTLFMVARQWSGSDDLMSGGPRTGQVQTVEVAVPAARR